MYIDICTTAYKAYRRDKTIHLHLSNGVNVIFTLKTLKLALEHRAWIKEAIEEKAPCSFKTTGGVGLVEVK
ncbi:MAG: hypothetical protein IID03_12530 [Candidatus Dadabacteria bacterium]|nr:hypothetical protein [Candidatus Dadabacteria bacterium]